MIVIHAILFNGGTDVHQNLLLSVINKFFIRLNIIVLVLLLKELWDFLPLESRHGSFRNKIEVSCIAGLEEETTIASSADLRSHETYSLYQRVFSQLRRIVEPCTYFSLFCLLRLFITRPLWREFRLSTTLFPWRASTCSFSCPWAWLRLIHLNSCLCLSFLIILRVINNLDNFLLFQSVLFRTSVTCLTFLTWFPFCLLQTLLVSFSVSLRICDRNFDRRLVITVICVVATTVCHFYSDFFIDFWN